MAMLFPLTAVLYILLYVVTVVLLSLGIIYFAYSWQFIFVFLGFLIFFVLNVLIQLYASKKYNKTLSKMHSDPLAFITEQNKFLTRPFVNKNTKGIITSNIACTYIENEQYVEALDIYSNMIKDIKKPELKLICFLNMANSYLHLHNEPMYFQFIGLSQQALNELKRGNANVYSKLLLTYEASYTSLELRRIRSPQAAQMTVDAIQKLIGFKKSGNPSCNISTESYALGIAYTVLGNNEQAKIYFEQVASSTDRLPYVKRAQEYLKTGNEAVLWQ